MQGKDITSILAKTDSNKNEYGGVVHRRRGFCSTLRELREPPPFSSNQETYSKFPRTQLEQEIVKPSQH